MIFSKKHKQEINDCFQEFVSDVGELQDEFLGWIRKKDQEDIDKLIEELDNLDI